jgi:hypothetical protein
MHLLLMNAWAAWSLSPQGETRGPESLAPTLELVSHCPADAGEWVARFSGGELARFGQVAGQEGSTEVASCLEAGLKARPLEGDVMVRLSWADPTMATWEQQITAVLDQVVGPRSEPSCALLRFPIEEGGALGPPALHSSSGSEVLDREALDASLRRGEPLPPVPEALRSTYGEHVDLCVGGLRDGRRLVP